VRSRTCLVANRERLGTRAGFPVQRLGIEVQGLTGNVYLERGQYLHLGMALSYAMASRRGSRSRAARHSHWMKPPCEIYERNYYDHPAFGHSTRHPAQGARQPALRATREARRHRPAWRFESRGMRTPRRAGRRIRHIALSSQRPA